MTPTLDRDRFEKCLALAEGGATAGERAAGRAAAARVAAAANLTLGEARAALRPGAARPREGRAGAGGGEARRAAYPWARPREPARPVTVEELLRQKAETEAWRRRAAATAGRRRAAEAAEQAEYRAAQALGQAERDHAWPMAEDLAGEEASGGTACSR